MGLQLCEGWRSEESVRNGDPQAQQGRAGGRYLRAKLTISLEGPGGEKASQVLPQGQVGWRPTRIRRMMLGQYLAWHLRSVVRRWGSSAG